MQLSIREKLENILDRYKVLEQEQMDDAIMVDHKAFERVGKEMHSIAMIVDEFKFYLNLEQQKKDAEEMLQDAELAELAESEVKELTNKMADTEKVLLGHLLPKDPDDDKDIYLEIRSGAGGDEASLFVADLLRMYLMYADQMKWKCELVSQSVSNQGGYKEVVYSLKGKSVYRMMKYESGTHRVQRIPATESQGRIHTSTITVAILPQIEQVSEVNIQSQDLRIDTYRSSGAGGQHVNTTDSAVRITHIPTGTVVECQDERSQHKNKAKAMALLSSKILAQERLTQRLAMSTERSTQVGSGDRSERIRTYNFPQGRITDHRVGLTLYQLDDVMAGNIQEFIDALIRDDKSKRLAGLMNE